MTAYDKAQRELAAIRESLSNATLSGTKQWPKTVRGIIKRIDGVVDRLERASAQIGKTGIAKTAESTPRYLRKTRGGGRRKREVSQLATFNGNSLVCRHVAVNVEMELQEEFKAAKKGHRRQFEAVVVRSGGGYNIAINIPPRTILRDGRISDASPATDFRAILHSELRKAGVRAFASNS